MGKRHPKSRIEKVRRTYNQLVATETLEDYALRYTPATFRHWSELLVANTAIGSISFLALEAIGASIAINYGFATAFWGILIASVIIFLSSIPIAYYAAHYNIDIDLLTRSAGYGYIGSTITSLIYASFSFIFFALEAAIMAQALFLYTGVPLVIGYALCSIIIVPLVFFGISLINRLQFWTQPIWLVLMILPFVMVLIKEPHAVKSFLSFSGTISGNSDFSFYYFGFALGISLSLIAQIGEQVDYLRFMPDRTRQNRVIWWFSVVAAGPGWIVLGFLKQIAGIFLAALVLLTGLSLLAAKEPINMYNAAYHYVFDHPDVALFMSFLFVMISQVKINVTNAYAGSLAWSNFFSRTTHSHPGRVVWLIFNISIALLLMEIGVFHVLEKVLGLYSNVAIAWIAAMVADLTINKPLGLSPPMVEFKRAHLFNINPVGVFSMLIASVASVVAFTGLLGDYLQAFSSIIALLMAFILSPVIAYLTKGRYYLARTPHEYDHDHLHHCGICEKQYVATDMAQCPIYDIDICSLCCTLDARCHDACKPANEFNLKGKMAGYLKHQLGKHISPANAFRFVSYISIAIGLVAMNGFILWLTFTVQADNVPLESVPFIKSSFMNVFYILVLISLIAAWWIVLLQESRILVETELTQQNLDMEREIGERRTAEQRAYQLANYDALTQLPNRSLLYSRIEHALAVAERQNKRVALLFLDLDHFKAINDSLGHHIGDALLQSVAKQLCQCVRESDTVARLAGDEFVILLEGIDQAKDAEVVAKKIFTGMLASHKLKDNHLNASFSIGVAIYPNDGTDMATLMKNADAAMYHAKERGRNNYQLYNKALTDKIYRRMQLDNELHRAVREKQFSLSYQPQYDTRQHKIIGVEALIRWQHPTKGLLLPKYFIAFAEQSHLILDIGKWVLETACAQGAVWCNQGFNVPVSVNISEKQFHQENFTQRLELILSDTGFPPELLELEVVERIVMQDASSAIERLHAVKQLGVNLAIDDFGTGYSSLSHLKQFPLDRIKIDKSFVKDLNNNPDGAIITDTIIDLAHNLCLDVIAEGVETEQQVKYLQEKGCYLMQGFAFYKPETAEKMGSLFNEK